MKRLLFILLLTAVSMAAHTAPLDIWVSVHGSDKNIGTKESPMGTVHAALRKARDLRRLNDLSVYAGVNIIVRGGLYQFEEPLFIRPEDSGNETSRTIIRNAEGEQPVFSGGRRLMNWKKLTTEIDVLPLAARGKVWVATIDDVPDFRQLWVNDIKATRARFPNAGKMDRILPWK